ncbi:MAG: leucine-rich repeat protein, partial [Clostridia bacterium]|nr:leucine-rich repeat protein [Clostridia bacterium]
MKKRFFRAITLLLAAAVVLGMLVFSPVASAESSGGWVYEVINGGALIVGYYGPAGDITVPSSIGGYPVTGLNGELFMDNKSITGITIADSVFSIGGKAFSGCTNLTKIKLPSSLKTIDPWTFFECKKLTSLTIPANVTSIGNAAFRGCEKLGSITIPNKVTTIGNGAFVQCNALKSITIPNSVTTIGENAFGFCSSLTTVTIGSGVTKFGWDAFNGCSSLKNIFFRGTKEKWSTYSELWVPSGATVYFENQGPFADVRSDAYYAGAVNWAVEKGITVGTGDWKFSPDEGCTRGQVVTFLWRAAGSPEPEKKDNPFVDVKLTDYFYKAVLW